MSYEYEKGYEGKGPDCCPRPGPETSCPQKCIEGKTPVEVPWEVIKNK